MYSRCIISGTLCFCSHLLEAIFKNKYRVINILQPLIKKYALSFKNCFHNEKVEVLFWTFGISSINVVVETTDIKCGPLSKYLFQRTQQHGSCTKPLGNDRFAWKIMSSSYHMEYEVVIGVSCINDTHTWERLFCCCYF